MFRVTVPRQNGGDHSVTVKAATVEEAKRKGISKALGVLGRLDEQYTGNRFERDRNNVTAERI
jgi:hypothetical protein